MKKTFIFTLVLAFVFGLSAPVLAGDLPKSVDKLVNGTKDIITSPMALYDHTIGTMEDSDNVPVDLFKGILKAPFHMLKKAGGGVVDVATFPVE